MANKNVNKPKQPLKQVIKKTNPQAMFIFLGLILFITALVFSNSIMHEFLTWDDNLLVPENPDIKAISMQNINRIFTSYYIGMYQPLTTFTYALIYHFFKLDPHSYHAVSLILHIVNVALVFWLIYLMTARFEAAFIVSLFFGIHPMHVESVVWVAELKDVLYGLFFILSLCFYMMYLKKGKFILYVAAIISFILSCFSKSAAVTLPIILIILDYYFFKSLRSQVSSYKYWVKKIPFFIISVIFGIVSLKTQADEKAIVDITPLFSVIDRFFLVCYSTSYYIVRLFLPIKLSTLHYYPLNQGKSLPAIYYMSPLLLISIVIGIIMNKKYKKLIIFGLSFFLVTIALVLQIIPVGQALVAERYTYIPYIGLLFIVGKIYCDIKDKKTISTSAYGLVSTLLIAFALIFCYTTYERNRVWKDTVALFTDVIEKDPGIFYSYTVRGGALIKKATDNKSKLDQKEYLDLMKEGIEDYETSIKLQPNYYDPYFNIGKAYYYLGEFSRAVGYYTKSIELKPDFAEAYCNRAAVYFNTNNIKGTLEDCNKAISLKPKYADAYINRGNAKGMMKDYEGSIEDFNIGISLKPDLAEAYLNRGLSKVFIGRKDEGCTDFKYAYSLGDSNAVSFVKKYCK
jgi:protein O-mannosyl-transferase